MTKEATPKKVAFMSKPYSNEERNKKESDAWSDREQAAADLHATVR